MTDLHEHYAAAAADLRQAGWGSVADRFCIRVQVLDRTSACIAIMAAVDAVDCRRAAVLDFVHAGRWEAISKDQAEIGRAALTLQRVEVER